MNTGFKFCLLAAAAGLPLHPGYAVPLPFHFSRANATSYCQAFTPGLANTIRNRVYGAENVGTSPMNAACDFHSLYNGTGSGQPSDLFVFFANNSAASITIKCTLLTSSQGSNISYTSAKTLDLLPNSAGHGLEWHPSDNPVAGATDLGDRLIGINCLLPPGGVINDINLQWHQANGT
jgi:hypothetical protein